MTIMDHWPRGKYNGNYIQGFEFKFQLHFLWWKWKPIFRWNFGEPFFIWLCFSFRFYLEFMSREMFEAHNKK